MSASLAVASVFGCSDAQKAQRSAFTPVIDVEPRDDSSLVAGDAILVDTTPEAMDGDAGLLDGGMVDAGSATDAGSSVVEGGDAGLSTRADGGTGALLAPL